MNADPFGEANPFGSPAAPVASDAASPTPASHKDVPVSVDQDPLRGQHSAQPAAPPEDTDAFTFDDDPFAAPRPKYAEVASPTAAAAVAGNVATQAAGVSKAASVAAVFSPAAASVKDAAAAASTMASTAAAKIASIGDATPPKSGVTVHVPKELSFDEWRDNAIDLGPKIARQEVQEKYRLAAAYAEAKKIKVEASVLRKADSEEGVAKLCQHLRLSQYGVPFSLCSRVEMEGAQRNPGKGIEFPFWTYSFKMYTALDAFKGQPHHEGQAPDDYSTIHNLVMLRVVRRYRDFEWLRKCLVMENPGVLVPPIPEKTLQSVKEKIGGKKGESFNGKELEGGGFEKGAWQNDEDVTRCNACNSGFSMLVRKHHCRHCHLIFCSSCCPKPTGGQRFCKDCASLKGLGEMLMKNPDVAFRMRELHIFLQECLNSPLAESETFRLFMEAPGYLLAERKDSIAKRIESAQAVKSSYGDAAKEKLTNVQSWIATGHAANVSDSMAGVSPRGQERKRLAIRAAAMVDGFKVFRDQISTQLFEGLSRKKNEVPQLNSALATDADLRALRVATEESERALAAFNVPNKEGMFHMIVSFNFLIGLLHGMLAKLGDVERASKQRVSSAGNPGKLQTLNLVRYPRHTLHLKYRTEDYLDEMEVALTREQTWMSNYIAHAYKTAMCQLWNVESNRDPNNFVWSVVGKIVEGLKDPY